MYVSTSLQRWVPMPEITGSPEFEKVIEEVLEMHRRKGADYGTDEDFFANVSASAQWGISPWVGTMMRVSDKVARLQSAAKGSTLKNEGIEDSLLDIATYAVIAVCLFRRESAKKEAIQAFLPLIADGKIAEGVIFEERPIFDGIDYI